MSYTQQHLMYLIKNESIKWKIEQEAFEKANEKVLEAKSDKEKALEKKKSQWMIWLLKWQN